MPSYPGAANGVVPVVTPNSGMNLSKGDSQYLFGVLAAGATQLPVNDTNVTFEAAPAGATGASISVNLEAGSEAMPSPLITVEVRYNGAPGAGEIINIQEADTDADAFYLTGSTTGYTLTTFSAQNVGRSDLSPTGGKFMRVLRTKGANAVGCTVKITRLA